VSVWTHAVFDWPLWLALALVLLAAGHLMGARVFRRYPVLAGFGAGVLCTLLVVSMAVRT
jgi:hypothetical protein